MDANTRTALTSVVEILGTLLGDDTPAKATTRRTAKKAPAKKAAAKKAAKPAKGENGFVEWLRDTAEERKARQAKNRKQADWMRENGIVPTGQAWKAVTEGERSVRKLKALNAEDGVSPAKAPAKKAARKTVTAQVVKEAPAKRVTKKQREALSEALLLRNTLAASGLDEDTIVRVLASKGLPTEVPAERV